MEMKEALTIILASVILGFSVAFPILSALVSSIIYMFIIIVVNTIGKKAAAYYYEASAKIKFWDIYQYYWTKHSHFKKPLPLFWLSPLISLMSMGYALWLAILEFDIQPNPERVARRHGLYRFTEMTETQIASIAGAGILACLVLSMIAYIAGFGILTKLSVYYAIWCLVPIGSLDGTKILFGSRILWATLAILVGAFFYLTMFVA